MPFLRVAATEVKTVAPRFPSTMCTCAGIKRLLFTLRLRPIPVLCHMFVNCCFLPKGMISPPFTKLRTYSHLYTWSENMDFIQI